MKIKTAKALKAALLAGIESGVVTVSESDEWMNCDDCFHATFDGIWFMVSIYERSYSRNSASVTYQNRNGFIGKMDDCSGQYFVEKIAAK